jgi:hypothetical protein
VYRFGAQVTLPTLIKKNLAGQTKEELVQFLTCLLEAFSQASVFMGNYALYFGASLLLFS